MARGVTRRSGSAPRARSAARGIETAINGIADADGCVAATELNVTERLRETCCTPV